MRWRLSSRTVLFAASAVMLGLVGATVLVEIALRLFAIAPSSGVFTVSEAEFRRVPGLFSPGQQVVDRRIPALPFQVRIASLGYRGRDIPLQKVPGELRVFAVGDSFTYGDFVDDDETLPAQIERQLARRCVRPVSVINAGVGGSTITTQLEMVRRGWVTSPDIVVLTFSENDLDDLRTNMWVELAQNRKAKSRFPLSVAYPVLRRLALWHFALDVRARWRARAQSPATADGTAGGPVGDTERLRAEYAGHFKTLVEEVHARGGRITLVAFPSHLTVAGARSDELVTWVATLAEDVGVPFVNLLSSFRATGLPTDSLYLLPHDGHASPRGNSLASLAVAEQLGDTCPPDPDTD